MEDHICLSLPLFHIFCLCGSFLSALYTVVSLAVLEGLRSPDGSISLPGRKKDIIIRGGEDITPLEIESVILGCESVLDGKVFGVPHEVPGEQAACKIPAFLCRMEQFPLTASGKWKLHRLKAVWQNRFGRAGSTAHPRYKAVLALMPIPAGRLPCRFAARCEKRRPPAFSGRFLRIQNSRQRKLAGVPARAALNSAG